MSGYKSKVSNIEKDYLYSKPFEYFDTHWDYLTTQFKTIEDDLNYWESEYDHHNNSVPLNLYDETKLICLLEFKQEYQKKLEDIDDQLWALEKEFKKCLKNFHKKFCSGGVDDDSENEF